MSVVPRLIAATRAAEDAFFVELARQFPESTTGDFPPLPDQRFHAAALTAATVWVILNVPSSDIPQDR